MALKSNNDSFASINIRIHPDLKAALDRYCEEHIEKISEAVTSAIKNYIGFGKKPIEKQSIVTDTFEVKPLRLDVRVHPRLKEALQGYCDKNLETITEAVTNAIKRYIDFSNTKKD